MGLAHLATFLGLADSAYQDSGWPIRLLENIILHLSIRECGSTLYVGVAQGVSFSLYIGIGAKFENTQKTGERRLRTAEYRTVLL